MCMIHIFILFWKNFRMFSRLLNKNDFIFDIIHCIQLMGVDKFSLDWLQQQLMLLKCNHSWKNSYHKQLFFYNRLQYTKYFIFKRLGLAADILLRQLHLKFQSFVEYKLIWLGYTTCISTIFYQTYQFRIFILYNSFMFDFI